MHDNFNFIMFKTLIILIKNKIIFLKPWKDFFYNLIIQFNLFIKVGDLSWHLIIKLIFYLGSICGLLVSEGKWVNKKTGAVKSYRFLTIKSYDLSQNEAFTKTTQTLAKCIFLILNVTIPLLYSNFCFITKNRQLIRGAKFIC